MQQRATFGTALKAAIVAADYSQAQLARELGIDPGQVSRWANDKAIPHRKTVSDIEIILKADLLASLSASVPGHELYISAPITGLRADDIGAHNALVAEVASAAREHVNSLYWPGEEIRAVSDLAAADIATERNMKALEHCTALLYVQFLEVVHPSSALIELGCALGRRMKTTIIIGADLHHPFMLEGFGAVAASLGFLPQARIYMVNSVNDACDRIRRNGRELLGLT